MDLLTTILTCSLYFGDDDLVRAIADSTPEKNPFFVVDASADVTQVDPPPAPKSATEALARAQALVGQGGRPLLGLLQVPPVWMSAFGRELADAFDPCTNVAVGTAMLAAFDRECAAPKVAPKPQPPHAPSAARRRCVLRKYEEAIGLADFAAVTTLELHAQRPMLPAVADAPILVPVATSRSGPDSLLVPISLFFPTRFCFDSVVAFLSKELSVEVVSVRVRAAGGARLPASFVRLSQGPAKDLPFP